jgi:anthranilate phosphoribosyltransferase
VSSKSGSADILNALGINIELSPEAMEMCLKKVGMVFLFAPLLHPAMKYAMPVRKALQIRTVFNILGPLTNPTRIKRYLLGVYTPELLPLIAEATKSLGVEHALIVHGAGGLDELSISGTSRYYEVKNGSITSGELNPEDFGLSIAPIEELKGGTPQENAEITRNILNGTLKGAKRDVVVLNAGAGIWMSGKVDNLKAGIQLAEQSIDSGAAMNVLDELVKFTQHYKK